MAEKLLINVAHEETRVALVESGRLANFEIITSLADNNKGSIFKGIVHRLQPSLQAAFVDYGADKQGFLPLAEVHARYFPKSFDKNSNRRPTITDVLQQGQEVMVQVVKDEIGQKGATLTTYISLAGRSLAIEADSDKAGISRRVSQDERNRLRKVMNQLEVPEGFGAIMRTAAAEQDDDDIQSNQNYLMMQWNKVQERFRTQKQPGLIHQELPLPLRFIRDSLSNTVDEILVDDKKTWEDVRNFCVAVAPELVPRVKLYDDPRPLFFRFQVEDQIDDIFARKIDLPSGGSIVIDQAEALVAIDVNSGRVKTDDIEDTALKTNLEAAAEVARQLKIRDRGGLIVVDFIDMREKENIRKVEEAVRVAFASDKAKVKFSRISEFGLMEISRQRLQSSVMRGSFTGCSTCGGTGQVRSVESSSLFMLRRLKEALIRGNYERVEARLPVGVANYLLNRKRQDLVALEKQTGSAIEVIAEEHCPPMKAFVELTTRLGSSQRKARRVMQEIDLVRSEVDKRDLEDGEAVVIEKDTTPDNEPSVFAAARDRLDTQNRAMESELARSREIEIAQKEADESLRRQEELRLEKERVEADAERIRALDAARRSSLGLWGRIKAFFSGLPPIEGEPATEGARKRDDGARRKRRDDDSKRPEARRDRDRDDRKRPEKEEVRAEKYERSDKTERPERAEKPKDLDRDRDRDGRGRDAGRQRYPARVEGAGEVVEAGGAVNANPVGSSAISASAASEAARKKRRRRRGGKGREDGVDGGFEGTDIGNDGDMDVVEVSPEELADIMRAQRDKADKPVSAERGERGERRDGRSDVPAGEKGPEGREDRGPREGRGRGRDRDRRGRRDGGQPTDAAEVDGVASSSEAPMATVSALPAADAKPARRDGIVDLRQDKSRSADPSRISRELPAVPAVPVTPAISETARAALPKFGGVIDLRGGSPLPGAARPAAPARSASSPSLPAIAEAPIASAASPEGVTEVIAVETVETPVIEPSALTEAAVEMLEIEAADGELAADDVVDEAEAEEILDEDASEGRSAPRKRRGGRSRRAPRASADAKGTGGDVPDGGPENA